MEDEIGLGEKEERLLSLYYDNECGWLKCWRAKRLLERSAAAQHFYSGLTRCTEFLQVHAEQPELSDNAKLWDAIAQRIENEERGEFFLGRRDETTGNDGRRKKLFPNFSLAPLSWSLSGALACLLIITVLQQDNVSPQAASGFVDNGLPQAGVGVLPNRQLAFSSSPGLEAGRAVRNVGFNASYAQSSYERSSHDEEVFDATPYLEQRALREESAVEVDWIRSNGSIRLIQQQRTGAPLIWISRRPQVQAGDAHSDSASRSTNIPVFVGSGGR